MTPKEKAIQLVAKYKSESFGITTYFQHYKQCALIAVDEILKLESNNGYYFDGTNVTSISYWQEVKQEIEAL
jgi:hypothetical protein